MRRAGHDRNHGPVSTTTAAPRRLYRRPDRGVVGVATGIAEHIGVRVRTVRLLFVALACAGGLGIALYGAYLILLPIDPEAGRPRLPRRLEWVLAAVAAVTCVAIAASSLPQAGPFLP